MGRSGSVWGLVDRRYEDLSIDMSLEYNGARSVFY